MSIKDEWFTLEEVTPKPFPTINWLKRRLNSGEIEGCLVGQTWYMSRQQVEKAMNARKNTNTPDVVRPIGRGRRAS